MLLFFSLFLVIFIWSIIRGCLLEFKNLKNGVEYTKCSAWPSGTVHVPALSSQDTPWNEKTD